MRLFRAGNYDFYLVNCTSTRRCRAILRKDVGGFGLAAWLKDLAAETEKDAVVVGDFNRFLNGERVEAVDDSGA